MSDHAIPWRDDTRRPVREKAETVLAVYRFKHGCDPDYLLVGEHDTVALEKSGFDDVRVVACGSVQIGNFYAIGKTP